MRVIGNYSGELKSQSSERKYELKVEFPDGWEGSNQKTPLLEEYGYFLKQHTVVLSTCNLTFILFNNCGLVKSYNYIYLLFIMLQL